MLGRRLMALGAVLILCALGLTAYNHWDDRRAQREAARLLEELKAAEPAESGEETLPLDGADGWAGCAFPRWSWSFRCRRSGATLP